MSFLQGGQSGPLDYGAGADIQILGQLLDFPDKTFGGDKVAQTPSGHGIELGKAVEDKGLVSDLQNGWGMAGVGQALVNLVRDDPQAQVGQILHPLQAKQGASWVGRRIDHDSPGVRAADLRDFIGSVLKSIVFINRDRKRDSAHKRDEVGVAGVSGIRDDDRFSVFQKSGKAQEHGRRSSGGDNDLIRVYVPSGPLPGVFTDCFPQLQKTQAVGIMGLSGLDRPAGCVFDTLRGVEIGLTDLQVDNVRSVRFQLFGRFKHVHDQKGADISRPRGWLHVWFFLS